jgi:catechol 2,3-dioxygenase-like lactoylglutathione lyase family enzyme
LILLNLKTQLIMKKNYFLVALFALALTSVSAQFVDDMESYTPGQTVYVDWWTDWGCGGTCAGLASDAYAQSGSVSFYVDGSGMDPVLDLGNKIFGTWYYTAYFYIPTGSTGYLNLQGTVPIGGGEWIIGNVNFNIDGTGDVSDGPNGAVAFTFPNDEWFEFQLNVDISAGMSLATMEMKVAGQDVIPALSAFTDSAGTVPTSLGGINYYSAAGTNALYIDDIVFSDTNVGTQDFATKGFSVYPNPVNNVMNLQANENISKVAIYNVLGQEVYSAKINAMTSSVDMSSMASGAYFVKVNINGTEGTVKVIK